MLVSNKMSYILTQTLSFLSTCEILLLNIKKLRLYNVLTECTSMQTNYNLNFQIYSILENLKQKHFNFLMLGVNKKSYIFRYQTLLRFNKMYYLVNGYRFTTPLPPPHPPP